MLINKLSAVLGSGTVKRCIQRKWNYAKERKKGNKDFLKAHLAFLCVLSKKPATSKPLWFGAWSQKEPSQHNRGRFGQGLGKNKCLWAGCEPLQMALLKEK